MRPRDRRGIRGSWSSPPPAILAVHAALLELHDQKIAGKWRESQVWIGTSSYGPHTASFVPPHHARVPLRSMTSWSSCNETTWRCSRKRRSPTPSSRRSTRSLTATAVPDGRSCTACCGASGSHARSRCRSRPDCSPIRTDTSMRSPPTVRATSSQSWNASPKRASRASSMGAEAAITELVQIGALEEITGGRCNRRYAATAVLAALDAFAERAVRRSA